MFGNLFRGPTAPAQPTEMPQEIELAPIPRPLAQTPAQTPPAAPAQEDPMGQPPAAQRLPRIRTPSLKVSNNDEAIKEAERDITVKKQKLEKTTTNRNKRIDPPVQPIVLTPSPIINFGPKDLIKLIHKSIPEDDRVILSYHPTKNVTLSKELCKVLTTYTWRKILEPSLSAAEQCKSIGIRSAEGMKCWLCDRLISNNKSQYLDRNGNITSITPQCEHVLPAAAAFLFFGIINERIPAGNLNTVDNETGETYNNLLTMNYSLAHSNCNSAKSDLLFIKLFETPDFNNFTDGGNIVPNEPAIDKFLTYLDKFSPEQKQSAKASIIRKIQPLIQYFQAISVRFTVLNNLLGSIPTNIDYLYQKSIIEDENDEYKDFYMDSFKNVLGDQTAQFNYTNFKLYQDRIPDFLSRQDDAAAEALVSLSSKRLREKGGRKRTYRKKKGIKHNVQSVQSKKSTFRKRKHSKHS